MRVLIVGAGRLGSAVFAGLSAAGLDVVMARRGQPWAEADVYWILVRDGEIEQVARVLPPGGVRLHSAGAFGPELLGEAGERGVLHPLMSFSLPLSATTGAVFPVHARLSGTKRAVEVGQTLALALGWQAFVYRGEPTAYHAAACLVSGHLAALFLDAAALLQAGGLSPSEARERLLSLAQASLANVAVAGAAAISGPVVRGDVATTQQHEAVLSPDLLAVYRLLAARIVAQRRLLE
jgi:predicted short-subunit dehydrogenase-like oxidoreductase (DUF2520 family)